MKNCVNIGFGLTETAFGSIECVFNTVAVTVGIQKCISNRKWQLSVSNTTVSNVRGCWWWLNLDRYCGKIMNMMIAEQIFWVFGLFHAVIRHAFSMESLLIFHIVVQFWFTVDSIHEMLVQSRILAGSFMYLWIHMKNGQAPDIYCVYKCGYDVPNMIQRHRVCI